MKRGNESGQTGATSALLLDAGYQPAWLTNRVFRQMVRAAGGGVPLVVGLEGAGGAISRYETTVLPADHPAAGENWPYVARLIKFLLWQRGGWKLWLGGPAEVGRAMASIYSQTGERAFDVQFMGRDVYERPFTVVPCSPEDVPAEQRCARLLGGHLTGCRVGFDLGASDLKVAAVINGRPVFSSEIVWQPGEQSDPDYHYHVLLRALRLAAGKMPELDAIGGSSAGVLLDNQVKVSSLFRAVPRAQFGRVKTLFLRLRDEMGVPLAVINDGDVAALAGVLRLRENGLLGIALGSSEAAGYITPAGEITGWLNELAFAPLDHSPAAPIDSWSGDRGCGSQYLSQQCVFRLAARAGISIPPDFYDVDRLAYVQQALAAGHEGARAIWRTLGVYLGDALVHYADYYDFKHVLVLGRCALGVGGQLMVDQARRVLGRFPALDQIKLYLPAERERWGGQAIAAASLPALEVGSAR